MSAILLWIKSKLFSNGLSWVFIGIFAIVLLVVVLPNLEQIKERFGFETRTSLKLQIQQQQEAVQESINAYENAQAQIEMTEKIDKIQQTAINEHADVIKKTTETVQKITQVRKERIRKVKHESASPSVATNQISRIQIEAIWSTYCEYNQHTTCNNTGVVT